jgi:hypothetical protein
MHKQEEAGQKVTKMPKQFRTWAGFGESSPIPPPREPKSGDGEQQTKKGVGDGHFIQDHRGATKATKSDGGPPGAIPGRFIGEHKETEEQNQGQRTNEPDSEKASEPDGKQEDRASG